MSSTLAPDIALFGLRLGLFLVFIYEGWSKLSDLKEYSKKMPGGLPMTLVTGLAEFLGAIGVMTGILAQWAAAGLAFLMAGAIPLTLKWGVPFHTAKQAGWDFNLLLLLMGVAVALLGPGSWVLFG